VLLPLPLRTISWTNKIYLACSTEVEGMSKANICTTILASRRADSRLSRDAGCHVFPTNGLRWRISFVRVDDALQSKTS
jgi:hypothetical protein